MSDPRTLNSYRNLLSSVIAEENAGKSRITGWKNGRALAPRAEITSPNLMNLYQLGVDPTVVLRTP